MNTPTQNLVLKHAPDLRFMFGMIPDVEILDRAMETAVENAIENVQCEMYTHEELKNAEDDAAYNKAREIRDELDHILDSFDNSDLDPPLTAAEVLTALTKYVENDL